MIKKYLNFISCSLSLVLVLQTPSFGLSTHSLSLQEQTLTPKVKSDSSLASEVQSRPDGLFGYLTNVSRRKKRQTRLENKKKYRRVEFPRSHSPSPDNRVTFNIRGKEFEEDVRVMEEDWGGVIGPVLFYGTDYGDGATMPVRETTRNKSQRKKTAYATSRHGYRENALDREFKKEQKRVKRARLKFRTETHFVDGEKITIELFDPNGSRSEIERIIELEIESWWKNAQVRVTQEEVRDRFQRPNPNQLLVLRHHDGTFGGKIIGGIWMSVVEKGNIPNTYAGVIGNHSLEGRAKDKVLIDYSVFTDPSAKVKKLFKYLARATVKVAELNGYREVTPYSRAAFFSEIIRLNPKFKDPQFLDEETGRLDATKVWDDFAAFLESNDASDELNWFLYQEYFGLREVTEEMKQEIEDKMLARKGSKEFTSDLERYFKLEFQTAEEFVAFHLDASLWGDAYLTATHLLEGARLDRNEEGAFDARKNSRISDLPSLMMNVLVTYDVEELMPTILEDEEKALLEHELRLRSTFFLAA